MTGTTARTENLEAKIIAQTCSVWLEITDTISREVAGNNAARAEYCR